MKGLFKCIPPFAPDQSGVSSVLFGLGGMIVICDAGGCAGNVCGFDEPRWFTQSGAIFSAGLRDIDAILGRDERLVEKLEEAVGFVDAKFIAVVGTPVPAVIGTDFKALKRMIERRIKLPALSIDTTGIGLYDAGQEKAFLALFETFAEDAPEKGCDVGVIGATPLDMPYKNYAGRLSDAMARGGLRSVFYGMDGTLDDVKKAGAARVNAVVSPSGLRSAEYLKKRFGTPYAVGLPLSKRGEDEFIEKLRLAADGKTESAAATVRSDKKSGGTLIIAQQVLANSLRAELREKDASERIDAASWFMADVGLSEAGDLHLADEDELKGLVKTRGYEKVVGDPVFERAMSGTDAEFLPLPHYAVSGALYADSAEKDIAGLLA